MQGVDMDMDIDLHMNVDLRIDILRMDTGSWTCKWTWTAGARRGHGHTDSLKRRGDRNLVLEKTVGDQSGSFSRGPCFACIPLPAIDAPHKPTPSSS
jgi:hypothetical protein